MPNIDNFRLDSDYPMDKIVYFKEGTFTPSNGSFSFSHGLSFTPLLFGVISKTSNFAESFSFNSPMVETGAITNFAPRGIMILSNSTTVYFYIPDELRSVLTGTYYYRLYGFSDESSNITASETSTSGGNLILSSDYNYYKLFESGDVEYTGSPSVTINHNLGYKPFVLLWGRSKTFTDEFPADITQLSYVSDSGDGIPAAHISSSQLVIDCLSSSGSLGLKFNKVWYRIYANEA